MMKWSDEEKYELRELFLSGAEGGLIHGIEHANDFIDFIEELIDRKIEAALKEKDDSRSSNL